MTEHECECENCGHFIEPDGTCAFCPLINKSFNNCKNCRINEVDKDNALSLCKECLSNKCECGHVMYEYEHVIYCDKCGRC